MAIRTSTFSLLFIASALYCLPIPSEAGNFLRASQTSQSDVEASLASELANTVDRNRLVQLEDALRSTYASLPKNIAGNLDHKTVRYILHRLFVQRHGWYLKGLEPSSNMQLRSSSDASFIEWVPSYLQERLEQQVGDHGTSLPRLAALAATFEDLIQKEVIARLRMAYEIHELSPDGTIAREELDQAIETYYVSFLNANNFSATGPHNAEDEKKNFASEYTGWSDAKEWLGETMASIRIPEKEDRFNFSIATRMAMRIGELYHEFNDLECKSLKHQLQQIEGRKAGRVRLSAFYNKGLYSHWSFNEKVDYLRTLGALDESDSSQPQIILPNYIMARTNCLEASNFYALCCQNECEDLMGHLEQKIRAPEASVDRIIELVAALPSASVVAPRNLSATLLGRLFQVAESNHGVVPLHGKLFAQWMSHAFPRECPYPHEVGTTSPQTPDEWMRATGHESNTATEEEMLKQVESDTCVVIGPNAGYNCGEEGVQDTELPWSNTEELLNVLPSPQPQFDQPRFDAPPGIGVSTITFSVVAAVVALVLALNEYFAAQPQGDLLGKDLRVVLACISLGSASCALELFDTTIFTIGLCMGVLTLVVRFSVLRVPGQKCKDAKCCV